MLFHQVGLHATILQLFSVKSTQFQQINSLKVPSLFDKQWIKSFELLIDVTIDYSANSCMFNYFLFQTINSIDLIQLFFNYKQTSRIEEKFNFRFNSNLLKFFLWYKLKIH